MKIPRLTYLWLLAPVALFAQDSANVDVSDSTEDILNVTDVTSAEATIREQSETPTVSIIEESPDVELTIPDQATLEVPDESPMIPKVESSLPQGTQVVLELPGQSAEVGTAEMADAETISVDFPDEDVRTILRNVADLFDLNLVIPDVLQGRTSIKLRNITWRQVFEVVLEPLGYTYVEDRNVIRIKSIESLTTEPVDTRVFIANYARASELQGSIAPLIDSAAGGRIQVDSRSNALVITERPSRMNKIQEIIERLDRATDQVMIESKFIEVTKNDTKNLGINWASLSGYSVSGGPLERAFTRNREKTAGTDSVPGTPAVISDTGSTIIPAVPAGSESVFSSIASTSRFDTAVFNADQFEVILSALKTNNDVKLVSNPTVVTLNNTQAKIAIGERYPIPSYSFNSETGQRQLDDIEYEDIGITLDVTPQVNAAGFINLAVVPEVSSRQGFALVENTEIPIIASRRTETNIVIKDGFTLAIGGLVENETSKVGSKVPLLGDVPGVGRFFQHTTDTEEQRNLVIFITAKTLNPDGSTYKDVIDARVIDNMGLVPSELPGYQLSTEEMGLLTDIQMKREEIIRKEEFEKSQAKMKAIVEAERLKVEQEAEEALKALEEKPATTTNRQNRDRL